MTRPALRRLCAHPIIHAPKSYSATVARAALAGVDLADDVDRALDDLAAVMEDMPADVRTIITTLAQAHIRAVEVLAGCEHDAAPAMVGERAA